MSCWRIAGKPFFQWSIPMFLGLNWLAFIYSLDKAKLPLKRIADILQKDERIDIICWKNEADSIEAVSGEQHGKLTFRPGGKCTDEFGQTWTLEGDLHILDLTVEHDRWFSRAEKREKNLFDSSSLHCDHRSDHTKWKRYWTGLNVRLSQKGCFSALYWF